MGDMSLAVVCSPYLDTVRSWNITRTPGFVAAFVLRTAEEVDASRDNRELTPWALYVPILPIPILILLWRQYRKEKRQLLSLPPAAEGMTDTITEVSELLGTQTRDRRRSSVMSIRQSFSTRVSVSKQVSGQMMAGLTAPHTKEEHDLNIQLHKDLQEWAELAALDYDEE